MVIPPDQQASPGHGVNLDFFSQAIERYKKSVVAGAQHDTRSPRSIPPKKRSPSYGVCGDESVSKKARKVPSSPSPEPIESSLDGQESTDYVETVQEVENKRLASRVSSRRTREREKLRMDHFRNGKLKLQRQNKQLEDENKEIRSLIKKIKDKKTVLDSKTTVVQSMIANNNSLPSLLSNLAGPSHGWPVVPLLTQQQSSPAQPQAFAGLLLNAILQNQACTPVAAPPAQTSQEQQLLSLLGLVPNNPALAQMLSTSLGGQQASQPPPAQQQPVMFGIGLPEQLLYPANQVQNNNAINNKPFSQQLLGLLLSQGASRAQGMPANHQPLGGQSYQE